MPVVLLLAAAVILGGVVIAALGGAGEMASFSPDFPPLDGADVGSADVFALRPPMSLWGYQAGVVDDLMQVIARSLTVREAQIAALRAELAQVRAGQPDSMSQAEIAGDD